MPNILDRDFGTHRFITGELATQAKTPVVWGRITRHGRVHRIVCVILRWNFHGGTFQKPDMTFVTLCGPQRHTVFPDPNHPMSERCSRCDTKLTAMGGQLTTDAGYPKIAPSSIERTRS